MDVNVILNQMVQLFLIMGMGYGLYRLGQIDDTFYGRLNRFVLNVTMPAMILGSVLTGNQTVRIHVPSMIVSCCVLMILLPVLAWGMVKVLPVKHEERGLYTFMIMYPNVGFMGFPLMKSIFGADSVLATAVINMCFNVSLFTVGRMMVSGRGNGNFTLKSLVSPGIGASLGAIVFYAFRLPCPSPIGDALNLVGAMTTPLAMMLIGVILARIPLKEVWRDKRVWLFSGLIQLVIPVGMWMVLRCFITDVLIRGITLIIIAMPVANSAVIFAGEYGKDEIFAAKTVFLSTLISIVTIPLLVMRFLI